MFKLSATIVRVTWIVSLIAASRCLDAQTVPLDSKEADSIHSRFETDVKPLLGELCFDCHNADNMESGIRVDHLDGSLSKRTPFLWRAMRKQIAQHNMPPEDEAQPDDAQRKQLLGWIDDALLMAKRRPREKNGSVRRLTVAQYQNTLEDLLGVRDDYTSLLPPDAVSEDGFLNNQDAMVLSPLLIESYFDVAQRALDRCIVNVNQKPEIQSVQMDFGRSINPAPYPDKLNLGPNNLLLRNEDFVVSQPAPAKQFDYQQHFMRTKYRVYEGYAGNATVRGWKTFDSIYHSVYACMRGDRGYPKGEAYSVIPDGLMLRPAIPNLGQFKLSTTYGPKANFKVAFRRLPDHGDLRVTVTAARYDDGLLLKGDSTLDEEEDRIEVELQDSREANPQIESPGIYQINVRHLVGKKQEMMRLSLGDRHFSGVVYHDKSKDEGQKLTTSFMLVRLPAGPLRITTEYGNKLLGLDLIRLRAGHESAVRFAEFERQVPTIGAYLGLRRDCGSTQSPFAGLHRVANREPEEFVFQDAINNHPRPDVPKDNVNYLAGVREVGVRSQHTDGRDMPRVLIKSVKIEGPYYESWPPAPHRRIFFNSEHGADTETYARELISTFAERAWRRPLDDDELESLMSVFRQSNGSGEFQVAVKDALLVVLTSPQFLFLIDQSDSPNPEPLDDFELASRLSYFLWNGPPDERLLELAENRQLTKSLDRSVQRMIYDDRFEQFIDNFAEQWLSLEKMDVVTVDQKRYPRLISAVKRELRKEPAETLKYLLRENRPVSELVRSDTLLANETVAKYYGIESPVDSGFGFVPVRHEQGALGGLLSQAALLVGLSDGREANPVKRGAWLARKILAEPPEPPPPNVPELPEDEGLELTLREKLERHRNQEGCVKCHSGIDPWGLPLEEYDAGGLFRKDVELDASSKLPDKTKVSGALALKDYLAEDRMDQVAFSFLKHLATFGIGRDLTYNEIEYLRESGLELKSDGYRMQDLLQFVVSSPLFLEK